ncbi:MAG: DUF3429 domain-containing protein [Alphaproteobacteria bacterium]|jgi:hypothetical protein|nr:DUF3429 domain-containing protein [Alphaproteobacteria bacterium]
MAQTSITKDQKTLKQWANILGYSGTIPFISLAVILLLDASSTTPAASGLAASALHLYGAIILSFLGGLHWGRIACNPDIKPSDKWFLIYSVIPSLMGWSSYLLSDIWQGAALMLIAGFIISYVIDIRFIRLGAWQSWMKPLRTNLTLIACFSLTVLLLH